MLLTTEHFGQALSDWMEHLWPEAGHLSPNNFCLAVSSRGRSGVRLHCHRLVSLSRLLQWNPGARELSMAFGRTLAGVQATGDDGLSLAKKLVADVMSGHSMECSSRWYISIDAEKRAHCQGWPLLRPLKPSSWLAGPPAILLNRFIYDRCGLNTMPFASPEGCPCG